MKEEKVLIKGVKTNFKIIGEGRPLLILHGWGIGSSNSWKRIQRIMAKRGYKVIVPDFPGFGKSGLPTSPWDVSAYVEWLASFIDHVKLDKFSVIAHSFGARIIVKYIASHPENTIEKLVLVGPAGIKIKPTFKVWLINVIAETSNSSKYIKPYKSFGKKILYFFLRNKDYVKARGVMREVMKKIIGEDLTPYFSQIKVKTLLVWGNEDKMVPVEYAKVFKENIKGSKLIVLPRLGHSPQFGSPKKFIKAIMPFLGL